VLPRTPPDSIVIRTDDFTFYMGARVDETWPARAEQTRDALGANLEMLALHEDAVVPTLAHQLGVAWPSEQPDFDVSLRANVMGEGDPTCDAALPRMLYVRDTRSSAPRPAVFFACVLDRTFGRLEGESLLRRGIEGVRAGLVEPARKQTEGLYGCISAYAVATVVVAVARDEKAAQVIEHDLGDRCSTKALDWLGHQWIKRVRDEESAEGFGRRAATELSASNVP
jgi:hypothetical protein